MSTTVSPTVTVLVTCFNQSRFVVEALESVLAQTYRDFQLIVTDDASTDGSADVIAAWLARHAPEADFLRHDRNIGLCPTLADAQKHLRGDFLALLPGDDVWLPNKLETQVALLQERGEDYGVAYSDATYMDELGHPLPGTMLTRMGFDMGPEGAVFDQLLEESFIPGSATLIRTSALLEAGGFDPTLAHEDWDLWLRLADVSKYAFCPEATTRGREVSTSLGATLDPARNLVNGIAIMSKWLGRSAATDALIHRRITGYASSLYALDRSSGRRALLDAVRHAPTPGNLAIAALAFAGISYPKLQRGRVRVRRLLSRIA